MVLNILTTKTGYQCSYGANKEATVIIEKGSEGKTLKYRFSEEDPIDPTKEKKFNGLEEKLGRISMEAARRFALEGLKRQVDGLSGHEEEFSLVD